MLIKRKYLFGTTILAGVMAVAAPAFAQSQLPGVTVQGQSTQDATDLGEVVITGSRIRRDPTNSPTPLIQVNREQLLETGLTTVIDYLATIPALSNSVVPSDTTGSGLNDGGLSLANLRSLGSNRTLTLVDGRRHVGSQGGALAVDVDTIPRLLIENIEIITGGASSVYGADAVSGVLNFVLRKDFEGIELDVNLATINEDGQMQRRVSGLIGKNFFDDRLNVYLHGEYELNDEVTSMDIDWLRRGTLFLEDDRDPPGTNAFGPNVDGVWDNAVFTGLRRMDRPRWGQTTLASQARPSPLTDPDVPNRGCTAVNNIDCFSVQPGRTFWYEGTTARPANFGARVFQASTLTTGVSRPYNIGGDGDNPATFATGSRVPESESYRFQTGATLKLTDNISVYGEAKYIDERTFDQGQPTFFDIFLTNGANTPVNNTNRILGTSQFLMRWDDNAYLPSNVKSAINLNTFDTYGFDANGNVIVTGTTAAPFAAHQLFGPDRTQTNTREIQRYVLAFTGDYDRVAFLNNFRWDLSYTFGRLDNVNRERGVDVLRFALAADAVVDTAGIMGTPGAIVCRSSLEYRRNPAALLTDWASPVGANLQDTPEGRAAAQNCRPLNVFGNGNQSQEALDYVDASIAVREINEQQDATFVVSGELFDPFGAGPVGVALGAEWRKEMTSAIGRSADTGNRFLFLNTGPDFPEVAYESKEYFAELSVPLFRDSWLGEYAELSGSYRQSEYSTVKGKADVYGVNFTYRPIQDIAFKTSFNTSVRIPQLAENFRPLTQTFANGFVDPCATAQIANLLDPVVREYRVANCERLAVLDGFGGVFDWRNPAAANAYSPSYTSGVGGSTGGNPLLRPEESESFTISTVIQPRFIPNFSLTLDYYEITVTDVIASPSAAGLADACVSSGDQLNMDACSLIFRNGTGVTPSELFRVGSPANNAGFIQRPINYAKLVTRGLDFDVRYSLDTEEAFGRNWGRFDYSLGGLWLIQQDNFLNTASPNFYDPLASTLFYPRVRMTSRLTWSPTDSFAVTWSADWQTAQDLTNIRNLVGNSDNRPLEYARTGNFVRNDISVRWDVTDQATLRFGVTNIFDAEQDEVLGTTLYSNFDPYGRRFNIGLNYRFQ